MFTEKRRLATSAAHAASRDGGIEATHPGKPETLQPVPEALPIWVALSAANSELPPAARESDPHFRDRSTRARPQGFETVCDAMLTKGTIIRSCIGSTCVLSSIVRSKRGGCQHADAERNPPDVHSLSGLECSTIE